MIKRHHTFIALIIIILYILYSIIEFKYKEYKITSSIEYIDKLNKQIKTSIKEAENIIEYKKSLAYRNKVLKEEQGLKNKGENLIQIITEEKYNKYTKTVKKEKISIKKQESDITIGMTIYQKWIYFLFKKDLR